MAAKVIPLSRAMKMRQLIRAARAQCRYGVDLAVDIDSADLSGSLLWAHADTIFAQLEALYG